ncbi:unnamed protein product, partial [Closterium sp. NIES-54]
MRTITVLCSSLSSTLFSPSSHPNQLRHSAVLLAAPSPTHASSTTAPASPAPSSLLAWRRHRFRLASSALRSYAHALHLSPSPSTQPPPDSPHLASFLSLGVPEAGGMGGGEVKGAGGQGGGRLWADLALAAAAKGRAWAELVEAGGGGEEEEVECGHAGSDGQAKAEVLDTACVDELRYGNGMVLCVGDVLCCSSHSSFSPHLYPLVPPSTVIPVVHSPSETPLHSPFPHPCPILSALPPRLLLPALQGQQGTAGAHAWVVLAAVVGWQWPEVQQHALVHALMLDPLHALAWVLLGEVRAAAADAAAAACLPVCTFTRSSQSLPHKRSPVRVWQTRSLPPPGWPLQPASWMLSLLHQQLVHHHTPVPPMLLMLILLVMMMVKAGKVHPRFLYFCHCGFVPFLSSLHHHSIQPLCSAISFISFPSTNPSFLPSACLSSCVIHLLPPFPTPSAAAIRPAHMPRPSLHAAMADALFAATACSNPVSACTGVEGRGGRVAIFSPFLRFPSPSSVTPSLAPPSLSLPTLFVQPPCAQHVLGQLSARCGRLGQAEVFCALAHLAASSPASPEALFLLGLSASACCQPSVALHAFHCAKHLLLQQEGPAERVWQACVQEGMALTAARRFSEALVEFSSAHSLQDRSKWPVRPLLALALALHHCSLHDDALAVVALATTQATHLAPSPSPSPSSSSSSSHSLLSAAAVKLHAALLASPPALPSCSTPAASLAPSLFLSPSLARDLALTRVDVSLTALAAAAASLDEGEIGRAVQQYRPVFSDPLMAPRAHALLGVSLAAKGQLPRALKYLMRSLHHFPDSLLL